MFSGKFLAKKDYIRGGHVNFFSIKIGIGEFFELEIFKIYRSCNCSIIVF